MTSPLKASNNFAVFKPILPNPIIPMVLLLISSPGPKIELSLLLLVIIHYCLNGLNIFFENLYCLSNIF